MFNIILSTFREIIRNKIFYMIGFFAVIIVIFSIIVWNLTIWQNDKVIVDFGLSTIEIFWLISVLFVGSQILFNEISGKTIYLILSKPIDRVDFILGKFLWTSLVLLVLFLFQSIVFFLVLFFNSIEITTLILLAPLFSFFKILTLLSIILFLSTFMSTMLTMIIAFFVYILSHSISLFLSWDSQFIVYLYNFLSVLFPPFEYLNLRDFIWFDNIVDIKYLSTYSVYFILYNSFILYITSFIFSKKEFDN